MSLCDRPNCNATLDCLKLEVDFLGPIGAIGQGLEGASPSYNQIQQLRKVESALPIFEKPDTLPLRRELAQMCPSSPTRGF